MKLRLIKLHVLNFVLLSAENIRKKIFSGSLLVFCLNGKVSTFQMKLSKQKTKQKNKTKNIENFAYSLANLTDLRHK